MNEIYSAQSDPKEKQSGPVASTVSDATVSDATAPGEQLRLRLFVAGNTPRSNLTIQTLRQICDARIRGQYQLEVIDIYQQPVLAREAQIIATPTLMKLAPQPKKIMIGNLAQTERVLASLGLGG